MSVVEGLPFADDKKKYILERLDPILEEMVSDVLTEMPKSPIDFMIAWLRKRSGTASEAQVSIAGKNAQLKQELSQATSSLQEVGLAMTKDAEGATGNPDEEEEEDDDDDCDEIPESFRKSEESKGRARASVSAEAYGQWNQKKAFTPPNYPKSPEQTARLNTTLVKSFMFSELDKSDMDTILAAMKEQNFSAGTKVINEGDDGDYLFVIEQGTLDCIKNIGGEDKVVKTCVSGDVFGELALLYNCPRAANVVAKDTCVCWQLDRETFNHIVKDAAVKRRTKYDEFLKSVTLISSIAPYERSQIADALKAEIFNQGDKVVMQGEPGDKFYIIEEGSLFAQKDEKRVMEYKPGQYFGELALLKNQPRAASVIVASETAKVLSMSRLSFTKMLGPLADILSKTAGTYQ
jgi:cAMP-dependent protein kinase regulator